MATHNANIAITIFLAALAASVQSFGTVLIIVPLATNPLAGARTKTYTSAAEATADVSAVIDAAAAVEVGVAFSQSPPPTSVMVGYIDLVGVESYSAALAACRAHNDAFYGVTIRSNVTADILSIAAAVEADGEKFFMGQTAVAQASYAAAFAAMAAYKRTAMVFHETATASLDIGYLAKGLAYNPDNQSAGWAGLQVAGVTAPTITDADRLLWIATHNVNVMGSMYGLTGLMDAGERIDGGEIKERITADWLRARIRERMASVWVKAANRGQPITLDAAGVAQVEAVVDQTFQQAEAARHTTQGTDANGDPTPSYRVTARTITTATRKITITVAAQVAGTVRLLDFNFYLDNDPVPAAA